MKSPEGWKKRPAEVQYWWAILWKKARKGDGDSGPELRGSSVKLIGTG